MITPLFFFLLYIVIGFFAGVIGGLLGIGGGVITVPCFFFLFKWLGYTHVMPLAVGTSLATIILNSLSATLAHHRKEGVIWEIFKKMAPGLFLGAMFGSILAIWLPEIAIEIFFGVFLCLLSLMFFRQEVPHFSFSNDRSSFIMRVASFCIGTLSNILGIGGGVLTVPLLLALKVPDKKAIGTSSAITLLVSTFGTLSYILFGWGSQSGTENLGYVNIPAFLTVGITMFLSAPLGVKLTQVLPIKKIRLIFAVVLILTGLTFISFNISHAFNAL